MCILENENYTEEDDDASDKYLFFQNLINNSLVEVNQALIAGS